MRDNPGIISWPLSGWDLRSLSTIQHGLGPAAIEAVLVTEYLLYAGPLELGWSGEKRKTIYAIPSAKVTKQEQLLQ